MAHSGFLTRIVLKNRLKISGGFFLGLLVLGPTRSCPAAEETRPQQGDTLVLTMPGAPRTYIPILASDTTSASVCGFLFNGLVKYDKDLNITGDLAASWDIEEGGRVLVFHLRRDVRWHDGVPFTADDVRFTYEKLTDPAIRTPYSGDFTQIKDLKALDPWTIRVVYAEPFAPALASWAIGIMPYHILKGVNLNQGHFPDRVIGTGPFCLRSERSQDIVELMRNDDYFEGSPFIDRIAIRIIPDESSVLLGLLTYEVDAASLTPLQYERQTQTLFFQKEYQKFTSPGFGYTYLGYNLDDPRFQDPRVRRAFNLAVDKTAVIRAVLLGHGEVITGPFLPRAWAYDTRVADPGYHPDQARSLLENAGWRDDDRDGWLEKNGREFAFTILLNQGNLQRRQAAEMIQKDLKTVGVRVRLKVLEWNTLLGEFLDKGRFEAVLLGWALGRDPDIFDIWHSSKTRPGEFNFIHFKDPEVDRLLEAGRRTFNQTEREHFYRAVHRILQDQQPTMFLYGTQSLDIVSSRFQNVSSSLIGIGHNMRAWWVPRSRQRHTIRMAP
jgi:peptide/nickel transport system substrate-binding protein